MRWGIIACLLIVVFVSIVRVVAVVALLHEYEIATETIQARIELYAPGTLEHDDALSEMHEQRDGVRALNFQRNVLAVAAIIGLVVTVVLLCKGESDTSRGSRQ